MVDVGINTQNEAGIHLKVKSKKDKTANKKSVIGANEKKKD